METYTDEERESDYQWALEQRRFIGFCRDCGVLESVVVNPDIIDANYATEECGWYFLVKKTRTADVDGYELTGELLSEPNLIVEDDGRARTLPPDTTHDWWSRTIALKFMKYGQLASTCRTCGHTVDVLLNENDYVTQANGERMRVSVGKW